MQGQSWQGEREGGGRYKDTLTVAAESACLSFVGPNLCAVPVPSFLGEVICPTSSELFNASDFSQMRENKS